MVEEAMPVPMVVVAVVVSTTTVSTITSSMPLMVSAYFALNRML